MSGVTQPVISRVEQDMTSPNIATVQLLVSLGKELRQPLL